ncbi:hypothetical protein QQX98_000609 [Neonectria punicea]|uniref:CENP-V/GFA domain-containing protein n=1 Tax=Neonectria punicea TaxID=979145 RepID=A0ABR1HTG2_9HYPO
MFCPKCGVSIGIDFDHEDPKMYGISVRQFNDVDLDSVKYKYFDGAHKLKPAVDMSGKQVDVETGENVSSSS